MASLYHIYKALEEEIERNKENPVYAPLYFPEELHRGTALEQDLAFWYGPRWQEVIPYTPAMRRYVQRLQEVGRTEPELLVAHAYTRYLGDLSGGQVLKKIAQKALELPNSGSLPFHVTSSRGLPLLLPRSPRTQAHGCLSQEPRAGTRRSVCWPT